ncbi:SUF system Fe-S cluster assembly regulator [Cognatilysobacter segetis]|uniref:SUF system Fe-S cluster assembly regulator n=1 Tax=Cognatilysobacter segetis TaxID=2492394 RepID=UPI00105CF34F|nr:SUF system Fe-S cluster assembly regulator [Lysobacter segetis]
MLRITRLTDYAAVVLSVLAASPGEVLSASDIAERAGLEATTVSKVLKPLAQAALVEGFRGAHGGYRLARPARDVALIDVIEAMEGPLAVTDCSVHDGNCGLESSCGMRRNWRRINDVIVQSLRGITLQDMLEPEPDPRAARRIDVRLASA